MDNLGIPQPKDIFGLRTVYLLWHTDSYGDEKLIGVYAKSPMLPWQSSGLRRKLDVQRAVRSKSPNTS
jgi:hypothetical protein